MQPEKNIFDDIAHLYDETLPRHVTSHYLNKRIEFLSKYINNGVNILDIGCGTGILLNALSNNPSKLLLSGCDSSLNMLKIAKSNKKQTCSELNDLKPQSIKYTCCDISCLPFKDNSFDLITAIAVFHHLNDDGMISETIKEALRVAKKGANIVIWDANPLNPYWLLLFKKMPQDKVVEKAISPRKIIDFIKKQTNFTCDIDFYRNGWVPDFTPKKMLGLFKALEYRLENLPFLKLFSAHYIIVIKKLCGITKQ